MTYSTEPYNLDAYGNSPTTGVNIKFWQKKLKDKKKRKNRLDILRYAVCLYLYIFIHWPQKEYTTPWSSFQRAHPDKKKLGAHFRAATAECWPQDHHSSFLPRYLSTYKPALFEYNIFPHATTMPWWRFTLLGSIALQNQVVIAHTKTWNLHANNLLLQ